MLFMVIERYKNGNPKPVYARFRSQGRLAPEGLIYVSSWVTEDLTTCYQVMETEHERLLREWMSRWDDIVDFEVIPVVTSVQASAKVPDLQEAEQ